MAASPPDLAQLLARRQQFKAFLASRLGSDADAEDLLQNSLAKALRTAGSLHDREKLVPWFYQLLRNAIVDHARSRQAARQREEAWTREHTAADHDETQRAVCRCIEGLIPTLKPAQAELLRRVELENQSVAEAAASLGLTANHAGVTLHRARKDLRARLENLCGTCAAEGACLDCDCDERPSA